VNLLNIGENIKKYRKEKKLTQPQLASLINKSESSVRKYENGEVTPSMVILNEIADALDVQLKDLLGLETEYSRATSLADTYFNSIMKWSEDRIFNDMETICIREHFFDLLLRYKELINSLSNSKYAWRNVGESFSHIYKDRELPLSDDEIKEVFLKQELERQILDLVNWVKAFPNWMIRREGELTDNPDK
jgi:transcriptional regulator with XRE-family HTH domain